ncbi:MAG: chemotaxis protein CheW [Anaerosomatales bacterium]
MSDDSASRSRLDREAEEILRHRAAALARRVESDTALQRSALLVFRVGVHWYAVSVEAIREILQDFVVAEIPCAPGFVRGVASIRGEIVSVTDAAALMDIGQGPGSDSPVAIVLENDECTTAVLVSEVGGIIDVPASGVEPPLPHLQDSQAGYVSATVFLGDKLISVVNVDRILQPVGAGAQ